MSVITKTGDDGFTWARGRVQKSSLIIRLLGELDELNSWIGHITCQKYVKASKASDFIPNLTTIQKTLFEAGACVATGKEFHPEEAQWLEEMVLVLEAQLPPLHCFILPQFPSDVHIARAVCRRAERTAQEYCADQPECLTTSHGLMVYLNRLSDYLFVLARWICVVDAGRNEKMWKPE